MMTTASASSCSLKMKVARPHGGGGAFAVWPAAERACQVAAQCCPAGRPAPARSCARGPRRPRRGAGGGWRRRSAAAAVASGLVGGGALVRSPRRSLEDPAVPFCAHHPVVYRCCRTRRRSGFSQRLAPPGSEAEARPARGRRQRLHRSAMSPRRRAGAPGADIAPRASPGRGRGRGFRGATVVVARREGG